MTIQSKELKKRNIKYLFMLLVLFAGIVTITSLSKADAKKAGQAAEENVAALFKIDFDRPIDAQLPPCTESGKAFWTATLPQIAGIAQAEQAQITGVEAEVSGKAKAYTGISGEGQIVPVKLTITTVDKGGQTQTEVSEVDVLMIKGENDQWLLDALAPDVPGK
jgi:hypothetical protein